MKTPCWIDIETFSRCDIKKTGAYRYAEDPSTRVLLVGYALGDEPAKVWDADSGEDMPEDLRAAIAGDVVFIAHNSAFDRNVLSRKVDARFGDVSRWCDTMILAYSVSLPGALGELSEVLGLPPDKAKEKDGRRLVLKFSKPQQRGVIRDRTTDPEDWERFVNYCRVDVEAMREAARRIPTWAVKPGLWEDWRLDQVINDRGVNIDIDTVRNAIGLSEELKVLANQEMQEKTEGRVATIGQRDAILKYIREAYGYEIADARKSTLQAVLDDPSAPAGVRSIIETRLGGAVISIQKYKAMERMLCRDGTVKGTLQFMGASRTGRFAGRGLQLQNVARGILKKPADVEMAIDAINTGMLPYVYDAPNKILSSCLRGMLIPPPGRKFVVADLSNIEGRVLAWLAGEEWKIQAFNQFDTLLDVTGNWVKPADLRSGNHAPLARDKKGEFIHKGHDLYKATYARAFGITPEEVTKDQRQIGKVMELALGYQGGVGAFVTFAVLYGVDLEDLAHRVRDAVSDVAWSRALSSWEWAVEKKITQGLSMNAYTACEVLKRAWRDAHPNVVSFWKKMSQGVVTAIVYQADADAYEDFGFDYYETEPHVRFSCPRRGWLTIELPSGRKLTYPGARLPEEGDGRCDMVFQGVEQKTGKWQEIKTHGGRLTENVVQAVARDVLVVGLHEAEKAGLAVHAHVHDEIIASAPISSPLNETDLARCMTTMRPWMQGLPLAAAGFTAMRYRKD